MAAPKVAFPADSFDSFLGRILEVVDSAYSAEPLVPESHGVFGEYYVSRAQHARTAALTSALAALEAPTVECSDRACPVVGLHNLDECADLIAQGEQEGGR